MHKEELPGRDSQTLIQNLSTVGPLSPTTGSSEEEKMTLEQCNPVALVTQTHKHTDMYTHHYVHTHTHPTSTNHTQTYAYTCTHTHTHLLCFLKMCFDHLETTCFPYHFKYCSRKILMFRTFNSFPALQIKISQQTRCLPHAFLGTGARSQEPGPSLSSLHGSS